jgi:hypothetical protein
VINRTTAVSHWWENNLGQSIAQMDGDRAPIWAEFGIAHHWLAV